MPKAGIDRDEFVARIDRRRKWARYVTKATGLFSSNETPRQTVLYDAAFRSDAEVVAYHYALLNDHLPDLDQPVWLNEKIRWQFLNHPNPLMSLAADKIAVRRYLEFKDARIPAPALIAHGSDPEALAWAELPGSYVLKSTFGSGQNHVEKPGMSTPRADLVAKVRGWMAHDLWRQTGEFHYRTIPKRWLVEEFLVSEQPMLEYRVFCFMGEPAFVAAITERNAGGLPGLAGVRHALFDVDWNRIELNMGGVTVDPRPVPPPPDLGFLLGEARRLAEDFMHVRVDVLCCDGRLTFSELTFASMAACAPFAPVSENVRLGALMDLSRAPEYLERGRLIAATLEHTESPFPLRPENSAPHRFAS